MYKYKGTIYPIGTVLSKNSVLFSDNVIEEIYFKGFDTDIFRGFRDELNMEDLKDE